MEWKLRDLRGRAKVARAVIARTPALPETLARDWRRAARFYARYGVTEGLVRHGVPAGDSECRNLTEGARSPSDWMTEVRARGAAVLPEFEWSDA